MEATSHEISPTVLLVDGNMQENMACKNKLEARGYQVVSTHSGHEALSLFKSKKFDLVVTDIKLPDINGLDLIGAIASKYEHTPIVINTNNLGVKFSFRSWAADAILKKSSDPSELFKQVTDLLRPQKHLH